MSRIGRRRFLAGSAGLIGGAAAVACAAPDRESQVQSFTHSPEQSLPGQELWFATACAHSTCGNSVVVRTVDGRAKKVEGNPAFPVNQGKLSARGQAGVQSLYHPDRLTTPLRRTGLRGSGDFEEIGWDTALDLMVERMSGASGFLSVSGPLAGTKARLATGFATALEGRHLVYEPLESTTLRRAVSLGFGTDVLPYFDIANARSVISFGADFLGTWQSPVHYSAAYGEMRQGASGERGRLIQVEPRMSLTGANADSWVYVNPGHEGAIALSIAQVIIAEGLTGDDSWFDILNSVGGLEALNAYAPDRVAEAAGVPIETILAVAREFAAHQPGLAIAGGPSLAQTNGLDIGVAALLLNWIVGSVGRTGGVLPNPAAPAAIPAPLAPTPFSEWANLAEDIRSGNQPDAAFIYEADPAYGTPEEIGVADALGRIPFVVGMGTLLNDTLALADLVLPATHPFEEWGDFTADPGPGRQSVGYQQPVVTPWTEGRSYGDVLLTVWREVAPDSAPGFDTMRAAVQDTAERTFGADGEDFGRTWVDLLRRGGSWDHPADRGEFARAPEWHIGLLNTPTYAGDATNYPLHLVPFETVGFGSGVEGANPWLQATPDPLTTVTWTTWAELNPVTAADYGVKRGDIIRIETPEGSIDAGVYESPVAPPGVIGVPIGQGRGFGGRWAESRGVNVMRVLKAQAVGGTGALAWASTRASLRPTGDFERLPTLETVENARNDGDEPVVEVTRG